MRIWQCVDGHPVCEKCRVKLDSKGCPSCNNSGYRGRSGIYELIEVDDALRALIHDGAPEQTMAAHARESTASIQADGRRRILSGETSLQEVLRVTAVN